MNVEQSINMLKAVLNAAIATSKKDQQQLQAFLDALQNAGPDRGPTVACKAILNHFGFCVLHRNQVHALTHTLAVHLESHDFEHATERERLEELAQQLEAEAALSVQR